MVQSSKALILYQGDPQVKFAEYMSTIHDNYKAYSAQLSPAGQLPALMSLPVELFMQIYDILPVESQAMLGLTCKSLYRSVFPHAAIRQVRSRSGVLRCIEREIAHRYYCPACVALHDWHLNDEGEPVFPVRDEMTPACSVTKWCFPSDPGPYGEVSRETTEYELDYRTARLAVRAATLGPSFGPRLSTLEKRGNWEPSPPMVNEHGPLPEELAVSYHYEPRVVDGILHVRAAYLMRDSTGGPGFWNLWMRHPDFGPWICPGKRVFEEFEGQAGRCLCFEGVSEHGLDDHLIDAPVDVVECSCSKTLAEVCALEIETIGRCECSSWASQYCGTEWEITKKPSPIESGSWELGWQVWRRFDMLADCGVHDWFRDPYFDEADDGRWMCPYYGLKPGARRAWLLAEAAECGDDEETVQRRLDDDEERMNEGDVSEYEEAIWLKEMWDETGQWFEEKPKSIWGQEVWVHWY